MIWILSFWMACSEPEAIDVQEDTVVESVENKAEKGPVTVMLSLTPKQPKVGDRIVLRLSVQTEEGVEVDMPPFGEALGRFQIVEFTPKKLDKDTYRYEQEYVLQAPMSGIQTIPSLRIVFRDQRTGETEEQELLTDEVSLEIISMVPEDAPLDFYPARGELQPKIDIPIWVWAFGGVCLLAIFSIAGYRVHANWQAKEIVRTAYEKAIEALAALEEQSDIPIDDYYARLSLILRRYIYARFSIPVLEKTTPEFLNIAKSSDVFTEADILFLQGFFERSDDVKYAQQEPELGEGETELSLIRRFLEETKLSEDEQ